MAGGPTKIPYDTIWNVATRLVGQCPAFGGVAPVARAQHGGVWTVAVTSPRFLVDQGNHENYGTSID